MMLIIGIIYDMVGCMIFYKKEDCYAKKGNFSGLLLGGGKLIFKGSIEGRENVNELCASLLDPAADRECHQA